MARKKSRNPFGLSTLSCVLAGAGLYLLYRKWKGIGDPPEYDESYIPIPVPVATPSTQRASIVAVGPTFRQRVQALTYMPVPQATPATQYVPTGTPSTKSFVRPTVTKSDYKIYEPELSRVSASSQYPVSGSGASITPRPMERPTGGGPAATISESSKKEFEAALQIQSYWDKQREQILEGQQKAKEETDKLVLRSEDPSIPGEEAQKLRQTALVIGDQFSLAAIAYTEDIRDKFKEAFPRGINAIETQKVRDWAINGTGELTALRMKYEGGLSQKAKEWLIKTRRDQGIPVLTSF